MNFSRSYKARPRAEWVSTNLCNLKMGTGNERGFGFFLARVESQHPVRVRIVFAEAGEIIQSVKCLSCKHQDLGSTPRTHVGSDACCPRAVEAEPGGPQRQPVNSRQARGLV